MSERVFKRMTGKYLISLMMAAVLTYGQILASAYACPDMGDMGRMGEVSQVADKHAKMSRHSADMSGANHDCCPEEDNETTTLCGDACALAALPSLVDLSNEVGPLSLSGMASAGMPGLPHASLLGFEPPPPRL